LEPRLREMRFGEWEGLDWTQIRKRYPQLPETGWSEVRSYIPLGGETFEEVRDRVSEVIASLRTRVAPDDCALIVTHAGVLHALIDLLGPSGLPPMRIRFQTATVTRIRVGEGSAELVSLNEHPVVRART
jgi:broad specificity phosphatase PhoE